MESRACRQRDRRQGDCLGRLRHRALELGDWESASREGRGCGGGWGRGGSGGGGDRTPERVVWEADSLLLFIIFLFISQVGPGFCSTIMLPCHLV
jgi:hypothetical protein